MNSTEAREVRVRKRHYCVWCEEAVIKGGAALTWTCFDDVALRVYMHPECDSAMLRSGNDYRDGFPDDMLRGLSEEETYQWERTVWDGVATWHELREEAAPCDE